MILAKEAIVSTMPGLMNVNALQDIIKYKKVMNVKKCFTLSIKIDLKQIFARILTSVLLTLAVANMNVSTFLDLSNVNVPKDFRFRNFV